MASPSVVLLSSVSTADLIVAADALETVDLVRAITMLESELSRARQALHNSSNRMHVHALERQALRAASTSEATPRTPPPTPAGGARWQRFADQARSAHDLLSSAADPAGLLARLSRTLVQPTSQRRLRRAGLRTLAALRLMSAASRRRRSASSNDQALSLTNDAAWSEDLDAADDVEHLDFLGREVVLCGMQPNAPCA